MSSREKLQFLKKFSKSQLKVIVNSYNRDDSSSDLSVLRNLILQEWENNEDINEEILDYAAEGSFYVDKIVGHRLGLKSNTRKMIKYFTIKWVSYKDLSEEPEDNESLSDFISDYYKSLGKTEDQINFDLYSKAYRSVVKRKLGVNQRKFDMELKIKWKLNDSVQTMYDTMDSLKEKGIYEFVEGKLDISMEKALKELINNQCETILSHSIDNNGNLTFKVDFKNSNCSPMQPHNILAEQLKGTNALSTYLENNDYSSVDDLKRNKKTKKVIPVKVKPVSAPTVPIAPIVPAKRQHDFTHIPTIKKIQQSQITMKERKIEKPVEQTIDKSIEKPQKVTEWRDIGCKSFGPITVTIRLGEDLEFPIILYSSHEHQLFLTQLMTNYEIAYFNFRFGMQKSFFNKFVEDNKHSINPFLVYTNSSDSHYGLSSLIHSDMVSMYLVPDNATFVFIVSHQEFCPQINTPFTFFTMRLPYNYTGNHFDKLIYKSNELPVKNRSCHSFYDFCKRTLFRLPIEKLRNLESVYVRGSSKECTILRQLIGVKLSTTLDSTTHLVIPYHLRLALFKDPELKKIENIHVLVKTSHGFDCESFHKSQKCCFIHSSVCTDTIVNEIALDGTRYVIHTEGLKKLGNTLDKYISNCVVHRIHGNEELFDLLSYFKSNLNFLHYEMLVNDAIPLLSIMPNIYQQKILVK